MTEKQSVILTQGGLWNTRRPEQNAETRRLLKTLIDEARINNFQHSQLTSTMLRGSSMSTKSQLLFTQTKTQQNKRVKPVRPTKTFPTTGLRTYNDIVNSGAYEQPEYHPQPIKSRTEKEKDRLANLMAYGKDPTKIVPKTTTYSPSSSSREIDRFDELVLEVEQRKHFLDQMTALGKRKEYHQVIMNEIADKVREMELIDRQRSKALDKRLNAHY